MPILHRQTHLSRGYRCCFEATHLKPPKQQSTMTFKSGYLHLAVATPAVSGKPQHSNNTHLRAVCPTEQPLPHPCCSLPRIRDKTSFLLLQLTFMTWVNQQHGQVSFPPDPYPGHYENAEHTERICYTHGITAALCKSERVDGL